MATESSQSPPKKRSRSSSSTDVEAPSFGKCRNIESFEKLNRIGEGTYGLVYRAVDKTTGGLVGLKRIILHNEKSDGFPLTSLREIKTLRRVSNHTHCVHLHDIAVGPRRDAVFLVFEYCEHDLAVLLGAVNKPFKESEVKTLIRQLLSAVDHLHSQHIIHRDIKLSNLLYNNRGQLKLADFGLARIYSLPMEAMTQKVVSLWYRAPELLFGSNMYSVAIDNWAIGCVMAELLRGKPLLPGSNEIEQISMIFNLLGAPTVRIWPGVTQMPLVQDMKVDLVREQVKNPFCKLPSYFMDIGDDGTDLLLLLLAYDPERRTNAVEAMKHEYFRRLPYPTDEVLMPTFPTLHDQMMPTEHDSRRSSGTLGLGYKLGGGKNNGK